jgi:SAM-dependent MidA family methyltransferase
MTPLGDLLLRRIAMTGPMSVAEYMTECLLHPQHGYYTTRDPLGAGGDFTTAPEISQMFGEILGLALAQAWIDRGRPRPLVLAELGPGRGTLMSDILRATATTGLPEAADIRLVEASPALRARQAAALEGRRVEWVTRVEDLPEAPLLLVANEFLDALPVRQFVRAGAAWRERVVCGSGDALRFGLTPPSARPELDDRLDDVEDGGLVEVSSATAALAGEIGWRIARHGGVAILIDYGGQRSRGDTLQAVRGHAPTNPLEAPGESDLTAHVDFAAVAKAARAAGAEVSALVPQGVLLERLGITERGRHLAAELAGDALRGHVAAHRRLTHPEEMGSLFQAIALHDGRLPPGFDA